MTMRENTFLVLCIYLTNSQQCFLSTAKNYNIGKTSLFGS